MLLRLFEVGFKTNAEDTTYLFKDYVAAEDAAGAEEKARAHYASLHTRTLSKHCCKTCAMAIKQNPADTATLSQRIYLAKLLDMGPIIT